MSLNESTIVQFLSEWVEVSGLLSCREFFTVVDLKGWIGSYFLFFHHFLWLFSLIVCILLLCREHGLCQRYVSSSSPKKTGPLKGRSDYIIYSGNVSDKSQTWLGWHPFAWERSSSWECFFLGRGCGSSPFGRIRVHFYS